MQSRCYLNSTDVEIDTDEITSHVRNSSQFKIHPLGHLCPFSQDVTEKTSPSGGPYKDQMPAQLPQGTRLWASRDGQCLRALEGAGLLPISSHTRPGTRKLRCLHLTSD
jgi:hypothetical protein